MEKVEETLLCSGAGVLSWLHENIILYIILSLASQSITCFCIGNTLYDAGLELCHGLPILVDQYLTMEVCPFSLCCVIRQDP